MIALGSGHRRARARLATRITATGLRRLFAAFLVLVAIRLLRQTPAVSATAAPPGLSGFLWGSVGLGAGLLAGVLGVGGGIPVVPVLTLVFGLFPTGGSGNVARRHGGDRPDRRVRALPPRQRGVAPGPDAGDRRGAGRAAGRLARPAAPHAVLVRGFARSFSSGGERLDTEGSQSPDT
jgi:hypothetical protein